MLRGFDIYEETNPINFVQAKKDGFYFGFAKAIEGATYRDSKFESNYKAIRQAGLVPGSYNFARPKTSSAVDEARAYVEVVNAAGGFKGALPPTLDAEDMDTGFTKEQMQTWLTEWHSEIKTLTGLKPILYTFPGFIEAYGVPQCFIDDGYLWIAQYGVKEPNYAPFPKFTFWQDTDKLDVQGAIVDGDLFNGTEAELLALCGITSQTVVAAPEKPAASEPPTNRTVYIVQKGDTLWSISLRYRVPLRVLARFNGIEDVNHIQVGQQIKIPEVYTVKPGDTLSKVFPTNWQEIAAINAINPDVIWAGQAIYY